MSFRDWYHPDRNSPEGRSPGRAGMEAGLQIGSMFGPVGAGIGAIAGGFAGAIFGSSGARKRARRRATNASYSFAEELFTYAGESRANIRKEYDANLSMITARAAASGARRGESFDIAKGKLIRERDRALGDIDAEVAEFRSGENYEWFVKDYRRVTGATRIHRGGGKGDEGSVTLRLGGRSRSSRRHHMPSPYDPKVLGDAELRVRSVTWQGGYLSSGSQSFKTQMAREYWDRIRPSMAQYEQLVFGGKEGKKAYREYMQERIEQANKWYDAEYAVRSLEAARRARRQREQDNKR